MYYPTALRLLSFNLKCSVLFYIIAKLFCKCFCRPKRAQFRELVTALPAEMQLHVLQYLNKKDRDSFGRAFPWWRRLVDAHRDKLPELTPEDLEKQQKDKLARRAFFYRLVIRLWPLYQLADEAYDALEALETTATWLAYSRVFTAFLAARFPAVASLIIWPLINTSYGTPDWWFEFVIWGVLFIYKSFMAFDYCLYWYSILYHSVDFGQPPNGTFDRAHLFCLLFAAIMSVFIFVSLFFLPPPVIFSSCVLLLMFCAILFVMAL